MQINGKEYRLVPVEPTEEMLDAICNAPLLFSSPDDSVLREHWALLLAATPTPPEATEAVQISAYDLLDGILVQRVQQMDKSYLWAVRQMGNCLSITGEWHYEPTPSSRDDKWLALHRFPTAQTAIDAAIAAGGEE